MSKSVFDRLAHQGTVASEARRVEGKTIREQYQQRRAAAAAATFPMSKGSTLKLKQSQLPQDQFSPMKIPRRTHKQQDMFYDRLAHDATISSDGNKRLVKPVEEKSPKKLTSSKKRDAFFRRLAHKETIASAGHHIKLPAGHESPLKSPKSQAVGQRNLIEVFERLHKQDTVAKRAHYLQEETLEPLKSPERAVGQSDQIEIFDRLHKQDTAATRAHHLKEETQPISPKISSNATPPSLLKRLGAASSPPVPIKMTLHIRTREEKKGGKPYSNLYISETDVRHQINAFHSGKVSARALASDLINALFHRDFTPGRHWDIETATVDELASLTDKEGTSILNAEKQAVWDWKDIYSVASAKATIKISSEDIYVDEYSYYVAG